MERANTVLNAPGRLPLVGPAPAGNGSWQFDYLKNDCEGYGNPRRYMYPTTAGCPVAPEPCLTVDIGADELGDCIAAGYRFGTT